MGVLFFFFVNFVQATGGFQGNGGYVVFCQKNYNQLDGQKAMLLDIYKAKFVWNFSEVRESGTDHFEIARSLVKRFPTYELAGRIPRYLEGIGKFSKDVNIRYNLSFPELPDYGVVELPGPDCTVKQFILLQKPILPGEYTYNIDRGIWDELDEFNRAVAVVHEVAHLEKLEQRKTQYLIAHIVADKMQSLSLESYREFLTTLGMDFSRNIPGLGEVPPSDISLNPDGSLSEVNTNEYRFSRGTLSSLNNMYSGKYGLFGILHWKGLDAIVKFFDDGSVRFKLGWDGVPYQSSWRRRGTINGRYIEAIYGYTFYDETGHLLRTPGMRSIIPLGSGCHMFHKFEIIEIEFDTNRRVSEMIVEASKSLTPSIPDCYAEGGSVKIIAEKGDRNFFRIKLNRR